jgi:beta-N-acetylhexosaminidase
MSLPEFISWRDSGGLVVSDDLGSRAVRRFFDPTERVFDSRQVARNAFLAGNDLLYADDFTANGDPDNYTTQVRVLESFSQKYREDPVFAEQVDTSVRRILTLKLRLYGSFDLTTVLPSAGGIEAIGQSQQVALDVARQSVTLISPTISELDSVLPKPPEFRERIIFFTDVLPNQQCSLCAEWSLLDVDSLQNTIIRLYGTGTVIQVTPERLFSYSFSDLTAFLDSTSPPENLESDLQVAEWVVVATLNPSSSRPESLALRRILSERPDLLRNKKVVVFAFNAPYYLDATDISKLTAFYGLYSKGPAFIEVAARVLFQELTPSGALPVSVSGIGYELIEATQPDPDQTIPLFLDILQPTPNPETQTPEPTIEPRFNLGDTIPLRSGVIYDQNRNPVPDGTPVRFIVTIDGESGSIQQFETVTTEGVARLSYRIDKAGLVEIRLISEPALNSDKLQLDIAAGQSAAITAITPTGTPSPSPTVTVTPSATITITPTPLPTSIPLRPGQPDLNEWALAMLAIFGGAALAMAASLAVKPSLAWGVRWCLITLSCGLAGYLYLSLGLPGSVNWIQVHSTNGILQLTSAGIGAGWAISLAWWLINRLNLFQKSRN